MNVVAEHFKALQDGTAFAVGGIGASAYADGWTPILGSTPNTVTYNGNRNYDLVFNSVDLSSTVSPGQRLKLTRTVAAPTQCTDLESGSSQYYSKTTPTGLTFTDDFTCMAWVKLESYALGGIIARRNADTEGFSFSVNASGQLVMTSLRIASNNSDTVSLQSLPLNKWVHVAATTDLSGTSVLMYIDGVLVNSTTTITGTITALVQGTTALVVGARKSAGTDPFDGKIAQAAVFSTVLPAATIRSYQSQGLSGSETSLISAYSFNGVITDLNTTNANNLTANGSAVATNADSPFAGGSTAGTEEYGYITNVAFSTNTTVSVASPNGYSIPTSGGISNVYYSIQDAPYGWPAINFNPYKFSVYRVAAATLNGTNKISWDAEAYDTANNFASGTYTVPKTGFYSFASRIEVTNAGSVQQRMYISLYKNGVEVARGMDTTAAGTANIPVTANINCSLSLYAGDTIDIYMYTSGGLGVVTGAISAYFMGHLIGQS